MREAIDGIAVAHRPVDDEVLARERAPPPPSRPGARVMVRRAIRRAPRSRSSRYLAPLANGRLTSTTTVEDHPPQRAVRLDDTAVREKLLEVAAHRPIRGAVRRAEIDEEHADLGRRRRVFNLCRPLGSGEGRGAGPRKGRRRVRRRRRRGDWRASGGYSAAGRIGARSCDAPPARSARREPARLRSDVRLPSLKLGVVINRRNSRFASPMTAWPDG